MVPALSPSVALAIQDEDRGQEEIEEVDRAGAEQAAAQKRVSEQVPEALGEPGRGPRLGPLDLGLLHARAAQREGGEDERAGVDEQRDRRAERLDEEPGDARAGDVRERPRRHELPLRLDVLRPVHERDHEVDVGEVEADGECTDGERDREQLPDGQILRASRRSGELRAPRPEAGPPRSSFAAGAGGRLSKLLRGARTAGAAARSSP